MLATVRSPEAAPPAVGVNVTLAVQDAPAASEDPQVFVSANGAPAEIDDRLAVAVPVLVTVTVWAALADPDRLVAERQGGGRGGQRRARAVRDRHRDVRHDQRRAGIGDVQPQVGAGVLCFVELRASELHGGGGPGPGSRAGDCGAVLVGVTRGVVLDGEALSCCGPVRDLDCHVGRGLDRGHRVELQVDVGVA